MSHATSVRNGYCTHKGHGVSWKHKTHRVIDDLTQNEYYGIPDRSSLKNSEKTNSDNNAPDSSADNS